MADLVLITGVAGGLGPSLARLFLARGDGVIGVSRRAPETEPEPGLRLELADLADPDQVESLWQRLERDDQLPRWLVNAAGGFEPGSLAESSRESLQHMLDVNLETAWWSSRAAARRMREGAGIVTIASRAAVTGGAGAAAYAVSKAALVRMTEVLAAELAPAGIRVNAILPSVIDTERNRARLSAERMVATEEISTVVGFLCSEAAAAVTGAAIPVYGWV